MLITIGEYFKDTNINEFLREVNCEELPLLQAAAGYMQRHKPSPQEEEARMYSYDDPGYQYYPRVGRFGDPPSPAFPDY